MYAKPDTVTIELPNITVRLACYSTAGAKIANQLADYLTQLVHNQADYLGGRLATDKYTFVIYYNQNLENDGYFADGIEHNQSTLVLTYAPMELEVLRQVIYNLAGHEFFHTQIPLGLHSYEIANFDFNYPKFSKHLWLYEGSLHNHIYPIKCNCSGQSVRLPFLGPV